MLNQFEQKLVSVNLSVLSVIKSVSFFYMPPKYLKRKI